MSITSELPTMTTTPTNATATASHAARNTNTTSKEDESSNPSIRMFELDHAYLIEVHIDGIQEKDVKLTFTEGGKAMYLTCKILRKMFYAAEFRQNMTTHKYIPWVFKRRIEFQHGPVLEEEVIAKFTADGIFVIMVPKKVTGSLNGVEGQ